MRHRAIIFDGEMEGDARPPRIIAPLQHVFDPILGASQWYEASRWGETGVPLSRFSDRPRIVFGRLPAPLPADVWEGMLYHLQRRLMQAVDPQGGQVSREEFLALTGAFEELGGLAPTGVPEPAAPPPLAEPAPQPP